VTAPLRWQLATVRSITTETPRTKTFTLKFVAGAYKAYCAPHEAMMFQHFKVS